MILFTAIISAILVAANAHTTTSTPIQRTTKPAICYSGQSYWCRNITTAVECNALKHCIHAVWEQEIPIEVDKSSVCQTCIDMVKMARDQLESNETQSEILQALEEICVPIPVTALRHDCDKLMADFGSYLVDTLASEMNPQVVCSVAGLCNSDKYKAVTFGKPKPVLNCDNCYDLMERIEGDAQSASTTDLYDVVSGMCGKLRSFSDVCFSLLSEHMDSVDALIRNNVKAQPVCTLAGVCSAKFHSHKLTKDVELINQDADDDLPCELCEQLVKHLKDVLVANTTAEEFKMILNGLCKMTKYEKDCDNIIDQYYMAVYDFLVKELDGKIMCGEIGICPKSSEKTAVAPPQKTTTQPPQLPIERMIGFTFQRSPTQPKSTQSSTVCSFCEYFLHFVQQEISLPSSEKKITDVVLKACAKLPSTVTEECDDFVKTYMNAFIALLANRIDPSQVCPGIGVCPGKLLLVEYKDKPTCPLCLLAMEETIRKVTNRTEDEINDVLDDLCMRDVFPTGVLTECVKFITSYRKPIADMLIAEFSAQESCVYVDLCTPPSTSLVPPRRDSRLPHVGDIETNEIQELPKADTCVLCEFVMTKLDAMLKDKKTEEEIKEAIDKVCTVLPKTVTAQCKSFVEQYADLVLDLLAQEIDPKEICTAINLCKNTDLLFQGSVKRCITCELLMDGLKTVLSNEIVDERMNVNLMKACSSFPSHEIEFCRSMVEQLAPQIEAALRTLPVGSLVCRRIHMCDREGSGLRLEMTNTDIARKGTQCYLGPSYWCYTSVTATLCQKIEYCQKSVWMNDKPRKHHRLGTDVV